MPHTREISIDTAGVTLPASLRVLPSSRGLVVFAHGAGSDRSSPRNLLAAEALDRIGYATLLFDLLTDPEKEEYGTQVFDIAKLTDRLVGVIEAVRDMPETKDLSIGLLGASTGAAAALNAAAKLGESIAAVVSRGGRPDLAAQERLHAVTAPTLFIIGDEDIEVREASKPAFERLTSEKRLETVPGATHLFEEPGTLESSTDLAVAWLDAHLS